MANHSITKAQTKAGSKLPPFPDNRVIRTSNGKALKRFYAFFRKFHCLIGTGMNMAQLSGAQVSNVGMHGVLLGLGWFVFQRNLSVKAKNRKKSKGQAAFIGIVSAVQLSVGSVMQSDVPAGYIFLVISNVIARKLPSQETFETLYVSGAKLTPFSLVLEEHQAVTNLKISQGSHDAEFVNWLGLPMTTKQATTHFVLFGETRSGKSLAMSMMLPILQYRNKRALIYDYSGNFLAKLLAMDIERERIVILNPFHRECHEWLLSLDLTNPAKTYNFCADLFASSASEKDKFFSQYAARILAMVMNILNRAAKDAGIQPIWGVKELCYFCSSRKKFNQLISTYEDTAEDLEEMQNGSDQVTGVISTLQNFTEQLKPVGECYYRARQLGRTVSLKDFSEGNKLILLGRDDEQGKEPLEALNRAVVGYCIGTIIGKPTSDDSKAADTFIWGDEFQRMGRINKLSVVTTEGGKYGVCCVLATQSHKFVEGVYGEATTATLFGNMTHLAAMKVSENQTAKWLSETFGKTTVMKPTTSASETPDDKGIKRLTRSVSYAEVTEDLLTDGHFKNQSKIDPSNPYGGRMEVTVKTDDYNYTLSYGFEDLKTMLPPKPTAEQERENVAPQSEDVLFFQPLTDSELEGLGLYHMMKNPPVEDFEADYQHQQEQQEEPAQVVSQEVDSDTDFFDIDFNV